MKIEQKVFELGSESSRDLSKTDELLVVVNDRRTNLKVRDLFEKEFIQRKDNLKGYSMLSTFKIDSEKLKLVKDSISISLFSVINQEDIVITSIRNPVVQDSDINIDVERTDFYEKLEKAFEDAAPEVEEKQVDEQPAEEQPAEEQPAEEQPAEKEPFITQSGVAIVADEKIEKTEEIEELNKAFIEKLNKALDYLNEKNIDYVGLTDEQVIKKYEDDVSKSS
jgi:flagellar biosynthesis GTPase FlhF